MLTYNESVGKWENENVPAGPDLVAPNTKTANHTLVITDAGTAIEVNSGSAVTITVPANSSVAFPIGTVIEVAQVGAGQITLAYADSVTLNSADGLLATRTQYSTLTLRKSATDTWLVAGDLA